MDRRGIIVTISYEALLAHLDMPPGTRLRAIVQEPQDHFSDTVQLVIEHPDFEVVPEGAVPRKKSLEEFRDKASRHENLDEILDYLSKPQDKCLIDYLEAANDLLRREQEKRNRE